MLRAIQALRPFAFRSAVSSSTLQNVNFHFGSVQYPSYALTNLVAVRGAKTDSKAGLTLADAPKTKKPKADGKADSISKAKKEVKPEKPSATKTAAEKPAKAKETEAAAGSSKDASTVQKTLSGYANFVKQKGEENRNSAQKLSFVELSKKLAATWKSMTPEQKKSYDGVVVTVSTRKKALSALDIYRSQRLKELKGTSNPIVTVLKEWAGMPESEKAKYKAEGVSSPKGRSGEIGRKKSSWQIFLRDFLQKIDKQEMKGKETFRDHVGKAAAEYKKLSSEEKARLASSG